MWKGYLLPMVAKFKKLPIMGRNGTVLRKEKSEWWQEYIAW